MEFFKAFGDFLLGILKHIYWLIPSLLSDPFDIAERWFDISYTAPPYMFWVLLFVGFFIAAGLAYYDLYRQIKKKHGEFHFEFNDHSLTTKDGRLILGVTYFTTTNRITIETLQLDYNGERFRPNDWQPIEIKHIHTQNYTFDLNVLKSTADETSQEAIFIAKVDGIEHKSHPFNIYKLL